MHTPSKDGRPNTLNTHTRVKRDRQKAPSNCRHVTQHMETPIKRWTVIFFFKVSSRVVCRWFTPFRSRARYEKWKSRIKSRGAVSYSFHPCMVSLYCKLREILSSTRPWKRGSDVRNTDTQKRSPPTFTYNPFFSQHHRHLLF